MRKLNRIIIHHTCSPRDTTTAEEIARWHEERGLGKGIQYHYVIFGGGNTINSRVVSLTGNHTWGWNEDSIGIALTGNFDREKPSNAQLWALKRLLVVLKERYALSIDKVVIHRDIAKPGHGTACPGNNLALKVGILKGEGSWAQNLIQKLFPNHLP